jgi:short-subunit dehydrogenase
MRDTSREAQQKKTHRKTRRRWQFNTNVFGLLNTTNAFLRYFRRRQGGTIVDISFAGRVFEHGRRGDLLRVEGSSRGLALEK